MGWGWKQRLWGPVCVPVQVSSIVVSNKSEITDFCKLPIKTELSFCQYKLSQY